MLFRSPRLAASSRAEHDILLRAGKRRVEGQGPLDSTTVVAVSVVPRAQKDEVPVLGLVENMSGFVCPSCGHHENIFLQGGGRKLAEREGIPFLGEIPLQGSISRGSDDGRPVVLADPDSKVARIFTDIAMAVACRLSVRNVPAPGSGKRSPKLTTIR